MNINETRNTLLYSLLMESIPDITSVSSVSSLNKIDEWLNNAFEATDSACNAFNKLKYLQQAGFHHTNPQPDYSNLISDDKFWHHIYKQEAILSAYETVRKLISSKQSLKITEFSEMTLPHGELVNQDKNSDYFGLYYLLLNHIAKFDKDLKLQLDLPNNLSVTNEHNISPNKIENLKPALTKELLERFKIEAANEIGIRDIDTAEKLLKDYLKKTDVDHLRKLLLQYYKKIDSNDTGTKAKKLHDSICKVANPLILSFDKNLLSDKRILTQLNTLEFYQYTNSHDSDELGKRLSINKLILPQLSGSQKFTQAEYNAMVTDYNLLLKDLQLPGLYRESFDKSYSETSCKLELADKVYFRYILEKTLSIELIDCICKCVFENNHAEYLKEQSYLLSQFCLLPNAFTRPIIAQLAMENLGYMHLRFSDFGDTPLNNYTTVEPGILRNTEYDNREYWKRSLSDLINTLRNFVFPIQNSYFFVTLWDSLYHDIQNENKCLKELFLILSKYLNSEKKVEKLLSFDKFISTYNGSRSYAFYETDSLTTPFQCIKVTVRNNRVNYAPNVNNKYLTKASELKEYFNFYRKLGQDVASLSRSRIIHNPLVSKEYIDKLYEPIKTNVHKQLYRAAKLML